LNFPKNAFIRNIDKGYYYEVRIPEVEINKEYTLVLKVKSSHKVGQNKAEFLVAYHDEKNEE